MVTVLKQLIDWIKTFNLNLPLKSKGLVINQLLTFLCLRKLLTKSTLIWTTAVSVLQ